MVSLNETFDGLVEELNNDHASLDGCLFVRNVCVKVHSRVFKDILSFRPNPNGQIVECIEGLSDELRLVYFTRFMYTYDFSLITAIEFVEIFSRLKVSEALLEKFLFHLSCFLWRCAERLEIELNASFPPMSESDLSVFVDWLPALYLLCHKVQNFKFMAAFGDTIHTISRFFLSDIGTPFTTLDLDDFQFMASAIHVFCVNKLKSTSALISMDVIDVYTSSLFYDIITSVSSSFYIKTTRSIYRVMLYFLCQFAKWTPALIQRLVNCVRVRKNLIGAPATLRETLFPKMLVDENALDPEHYIYLPDCSNIFLKSSRSARHRQNLSGPSADITVIELKGEISKLFSILNIEDYWGNSFFDRSNVSYTDCL